MTETTFMVFVIGPLAIAAVVAAILWDRLKERSPSKAERLEGIFFGLSYPFVLLGAVVYVGVVLFLCLSIGWAAGGGTGAIIALAIFVIWFFKS